MDSSLELRSFNPGSYNKLSGGNARHCVNNSSCTVANKLTSPSVHGERRCHNFSLMLTQSSNVICCDKPESDQLF
jgi:hypothetical protein